MRGTGRAAGTRAGARLRRDSRKDELADDGQEGGGACRWNRSRRSWSSRARTRSASAPSTPRRERSAAFPGDLDAGARRRHRWRETRESARPCCRSSRAGRTPAASTLLEELREQVPAGLVEMLADLRPRRRQDPADPRNARHRLPSRARGRRPRRTARHAAALRGPHRRKYPQGHRLPAAGQRAGGCRITPREEAEALAARAEPAAAACSRRIVAGEVRRRCEVVRELVVVLVADVPPGGVCSSGWRQLPGVNEFAGQDERRVTLRFAGGASAQVVVTTPPNTRRGAGAGHRQRGAPRRARGARQPRTDSRSTAPRSGEGSTLRADARRSGVLRGARAARGFRPSCARAAARSQRPAPASCPRCSSGRDLQGFLHCHTNYSDGTTIVARTGRGVPGSGLRVGRHHRSQPGGGVRRRALARRPAPAVATRSTQVNASSTGFRVLKGIEADILVDGAARLRRRRSLGRLDFVIGSIHSRFNLEREGDDRSGLLARWTTRI